MNRTVGTFFKPFSKAPPHPRSPRWSIPQVGSHGSWQLLPLVPPAEWGYRVWPKRPPGGSPKSFPDGALRKTNHPRHGGGKVQMVVYEQCLTDRQGACHFPGCQLLFLPRLAYGLVGRRQKTAAPDFSVHPSATRIIPVWTQFRQPKAPWPGAELGTASRELP